MDFFRRYCRLAFSSVSFFFFVQQEKKTHALSFHSYGFHWRRSLHLVYTDLTLCKANGKMKEVSDTAVLVSVLLTDYRYECVLKRKAELGQRDILQG